MPNRAELWTVIYQHSRSGARPSDHFRQSGRTAARYSAYMHDSMHTQAARFMQ
jgi:hypothetical protein